MLPQLFWANVPRHWKGSGTQVTAINFEEFSVTSKFILQLQTNSDPNYSLVLLRLLSFNYSLHPPARCLFFLI